MSLIGVQMGLSGAGTGASCCAQKLRNATSEPVDGPTDWIHDSICETRYGPKVFTIGSGGSANGNQMHVTLHSADGVSSTRHITSCWPSFVGSTFPMKGCVLPHWACGALRARAASAVGARVEVAAETGP
jgi:hypothetical protein